MLVSTALPAQTVARAVLMDSLKVDIFSDIGHLAQRTDEVVIVRQRQCVGQNTPMLGLGSDAMRLGADLERSDNRIIDVSCPKICHDSTLLGTSRAGP